MLSRTKNRRFVLCGALAVGLFARMAAGGWDYPDWPYRMLIQASNTGPAALTGYQAAVVFDSKTRIASGKMRGDGGDARMADGEGAEYAFWLDPYTLNATNTRLWVKIPLLNGSSATNFYLYYGNTNASSASDGDATFEFFDAFPGTTIDTNKWITNAVNSMTWSVTNRFRIKDSIKSGLTYWLYNSTSKGAQHWARWTLLDSFAVEWRSTMDNYATISGMGQGGVGVVTTNDCLDVFLGHQDAWSTGIRIVLSSVLLDTGNSVDVDNDALDSRDFCFMCSTNRIATYYKATNATAFTLMNERAVYPLRHVALMAGAYGGFPYVDYVDIENLRIRQHSTNEPSVSILGEPPEAVALHSPVHCPEEGAPGPEGDDWAAYGRTLNPRAPLLWQMPADPDNNLLHFDVFCSSSETNGGDTPIASSDSAPTNFAYRAGGIWSAFPPSGWSSTNTNSLIRFRPSGDLGAAPTALFWKVRAKDAFFTGAASPVRRFDLCSRSWTDDPLAGGVAKIRDDHINELREEMNYLRVCRTLSTNLWTDTPLTPGRTPIRDDHVNELRDSFVEMATHFTGDAAHTNWTDNPIVPYRTPIRRQHIEELRQALSPSF
jgi:hypothetical protein